MKNKKLIKERGKWGMKLGLHRIEKLLGYLNHPEQKIKTVHIAGSNGKGSVIKITEAVLIQAGYKTGAFTSPAMETDNDRIRINGQMIEDTELEILLERVLDASKRLETETGERATGFELETALAFLYFFESGVDVALIEVGLGGRLDATNVLKSPLVNVITHIALEHTEYLGETLGEIAAEKGAIIKDGAHVVIAPQEKEARQSLSEVISQKKVKETVYVDENTLEVLENTLSGQKIRVKEKEYRLALLGDFQQINLLTALEVIEALRKEDFIIPEEALDALEHVRFPGRFERLCKNPEIILDGAHNADGIDHLVKNIEHYFGKKVNFVFGMLAEKDVEECLKKIENYVDTIYLVEPESPGALSNEEMEILIHTINPTIKTVQVEDYTHLLEYLEPEKTYIVTGSLYLLSKLRPILKKDLKVT